MIWLLVYAPNTKEYEFNFWRGSRYYTERLYYYETVKLLTISTQLPFYKVLFLPKKAWGYVE